MLFSTVLWVLMWVPISFWAICCSPLYCEYWCEYLSVSGLYAVLHCIVSTDVSTYQFLGYMLFSTVLWVLMWVAISFWAICCSPLYCEYWCEYLSVSGLYAVLHCIVSTDVSTYQFLGYMLFSTVLWVLMWVAISFWAICCSPLYCEYWCEYLSVSGLYAVLHCIVSTDVSSYQFLGYMLFSTVLWVLMWVAISFWAICCSPLYCEYWCEYLSVSGLYAVLHCIVSTDVSSYQFLGYMLFSTVLWVLMWVPISFWAICCSPLYCEYWCEYLSVSGLYAVLHCIVSTDVSTYQFLGYMLFSTVLWVLMWVAISFWAICCSPLYCEYWCE